MKKDVELDMDLAYSILEIYLEDRIDSDLVAHRSLALVNSKKQLYLYLLFVTMAAAEQVRDSMPSKIKRIIARNKRKGLPGGIALRLMGDESEEESEHYELLRSTSQIIVAFINNDDGMATALAQAVMSRGTEYVSAVIQQALQMYRLITRGPDSSCPAFGEGHDHD